MIKATLITREGPYALIGISDENIRRMQAGMPLDIHLKQLTPPGSRLVRCIIHLSHTYEEVLQDWTDGGVPVTASMTDEAQRLDLQIAMEKKHAKGKVPKT
jgi:hypothetical protein